MSKKELKFRWRWFGHMFKSWIYDVMTYRPPKGMRLKRVMVWQLLVDGETLEHHVGTFWEFTKWIVTHETFDNL